MGEQKMTGGGHIGSRSAQKQQNRKKNRTKKGKERMRPGKPKKNPTQQGQQI